MCMLLRSLETCHGLTGCYWSGGQCYSCIDSNQVANIPKTGCISQNDCWMLKGSVYEDNGRKYCQCAYGFSLNNDKCERCPTGQARFGSKDTCSDCPSQLLPTPVQDGCISQQNCRQAGAQVVSDRCLCKEEEKGFLLGKSGQYECRTCDQTEKHNSQVNTCVCKPGYGSVANSGVVCSTCRPNYFSIPGEFDTEKKPCQQCTGPYVSNVAQVACQTTDECQTSGLHSHVVDKQCYCVAGWGRNGQGRCVECVGQQVSAHNEFECRECTGDHKVPNQDRSACVCDVGYYRDVDNTCKKCPEGYYKNAKGNDQCQKCPGYDGGQNSTETSNNAGTHCVCAAGHGAPTTAADTCQPCPAGTSHPENRDTTVRETCTPCRDNEVAAVGQAQCTLCKSAEVPNNARSSCVCKSGYGAPEGKDECEGCPAGTYHEEDRDAQNKSSCDRCENGKVSAKGQASSSTCPDTEVANETQSVCECKPGYERKESDKICHKCSENQFKAESGDGACASCQADSEISNEAGTACLCAANYGVTESAPGLCAPCPDGTYHVEDKKEQQKQTCVAIDCSKIPGSVLNKTKTGCVCNTGFGISNGACVACTGNTVHAANPEETNAVACTKCGENEIANENHTVCICKNGYGLQNGECKECPDNTYHAANPKETEKVACAVCGDGLVPNNDRTDCQAASVDKISSKTTPIIIGCVLAALALIALIAITVVMFNKRRNKAAQKDANATGGINYYNRRLRKNVTSGGRTVQNRIRQPVNTSKASTSQTTTSDRRGVSSINNRGRQWSSSRNIAVIDSHRRK